MGKILLRLFTIPALAALYTMPLVLIPFAIIISTTIWVFGGNLASTTIVEYPYHLADKLLKKCK